MSFIRAIALAGVAVCAVLASTGGAYGQSPPPTAAAPAASTATDASISIMLVEDVNENSVVDADDGVPVRTVSVLSLFTDEVAGDIVLYTAADGSLSFENIPSGDYTLVIAWNGGFVEPRASDGRPDALDIVFRVEPDGDIVAPSPTPQFWPAPPGIAPRAFDPAADRIVLGRPPSTVLLGHKNPDLVPYPTDVEFNAIAVATGSVDVDRAFSSRGLDKPDGLRVGGDEIIWVDRSVGESGYRVAVTIGLTTRTFDLAPDANRLVLPLDFRPACGSALGSTLTAEVVAFTAWSESEPALGSRAALCAPTTPTPTVGVSLPNTGSGPRDGRTRPLLGWLSAAGMLLTSAEITRRAVRS